MVFHMDSIYNKLHTVRTVMKQSGKLNVKVTITIFASFVFGSLEKMLSTCVGESKVFYLNHSRSYLVFVNLKKEISRLKAFS